MMTVVSCIVHQHNLWLVLMAAVVCGAGSWAMVRLFLRAASARSTERLAWIVLAAFVTGASIWCVHFVAMLGYEPGLPVSFDPVLTIVSLLVAMVGAGGGFLLASGPFRMAPIAGGLVLGLSIAVMHYTGMLAYRVQGIVSWDMSYLVGSVLIACGLGAASLHAALRIGKDTVRDYTATTLFFLSIIGLHFTGMTAFKVVPLGLYGTFYNPEAQNALAFAVTCVGLLIVGAGFASSFIDTHARAAASDALANMSNGLVMISSTGSITLISDRVPHLFGIPEGELRIGMTLAAYIRVIGRKSGWDDERIARVLENHHRWMASDRVTRVEHLFDDGKTLSIACQPVAKGGAVLTYEDVTEARNGQKTIAHMAHHDALTGLKNRTMFARVADELIAAGPVSALVVNLDRFKSVNDRLGHAVGDALLRQAAARLQALLLHGERAFRLGSDELAILTPSADPRAADLGREILAGIAIPFQIETHVVTSSCSVGIASAGSDDSATTLLQKADLALHVAKSGGRARCESYREGMLEREAERRALEHDLSGAIVRNELELWYQPLVQLPGRTLAGFEALIRWRHPVRGLVSPAEFIPLAESCGLINSIGAWVIDEACRRAAQWPTPLYVSINVSAIQLRSAALASQLAQALKRYDLPASFVEIEITESAMVDNGTEIAVVLAGLRALGLRIAMDDFGTGYSSLAHLREFKVDRIKIDRSFIAASGTDAGSAAIVRAVLSMARELEIDTTAEGIEEEAQLQSLIELGCGTGQGYLLGRPLEAEAADKLASTILPPAAKTAERAVSSRKARTSLQLPRSR